jgi:hypothetical protein
MSDVCGAKNKSSGLPCQRSPETGKRRCRLHGGAEGSGGPPGEKNGRYKHGRRSRFKQAERRAAFEESQRLQRERWPDIPIGYDAIIDGLRAVAAKANQ